MFINCLENWSKEADLKLHFELFTNHNHSKMGVQPSFNKLTVPSFTIHFVYFCFNHRSFLVYIYSKPRPRLSFLKMLSLKRSGWFESSVSLQLSLLSGLPLPWYLWCFPTSVNGFCNLYLIEICNWMSKGMQDCIGFIFLFSAWSRKIAPPPLPIKCKSAENQWHLSLKRYSAFQPGFVFLIWVSISSLWNFSLSWLTAVIS